jgi:hypothetical protein
MATQNAEKVTDVVTATVTVTVTDTGFQPKVVKCEPKTTFLFITRSTNRNFAVKAQAQVGGKLIDAFNTSLCQMDESYSLSEEILSGCEVVLSLVPPPQHGPTPMDTGTGIIHVGGSDVQRP